MTPRDRHRAILTAIAARFALLKADRVLKQCGTSPPTVHRVLKGGDHKISTLVEIADALDCDVRITIAKRA